MKKSYTGIFVNIYLKSSDGVSVIIIYKMFLIWAKLFFERHLSYFQLLMINGEV